MSKLTTIGVLSALLLLPVISYGQQTCYFNSIPASTPTNQFTLNSANGTLMDNKTGLMWKICSEGQTLVNSNGANSCQNLATTYSWQGALQQAQVVNAAGGFAGYMDWRVPNVNELTSIVEQQCYNPAINLSVFPDTAPEVFWTSSPRLVFSNPTDNFAYLVHFEIGAHYSGSYIYSARSPMRKIYWL